jgi:hypothetical protein
MKISDQVTVQQAIYASNWRGIDVTKIVQNLANQGTRDFTPSNNLFGDPDVGRPKFFGMTFKWDNRLWAVASVEDVGVSMTPDDYRQLIPQPQLTPGPQQPTVSFGIYSSGWGGNDVSAICQAIINVGAQKIHVSNQVMGIDPWLQQPKYLITQVGSNFYGGREGDTINLS